MTRCILYLTRYQEVQEAAREEVERVTGEERPSLKHHLPYCQANHCQICLYKML